MTDETANHDSTDEKPTSGREQATGEGLSRRSLLQGAAASAVGVAGLSALGGNAEAGGTKRKLRVHGDANGRHRYRIEMSTGSRIQKGTKAGNNDSVTTKSGNQVVEGEVWNSNTDTYTYTGQVNYVEGNGSVDFEFVDGAFAGADDVTVQGQGNGRHLYEIEVRNGDIELDHGATEYVDSDDGRWFTEWAFTADSVSGAVRNKNEDGYFLDHGATVDRICVDGGHVRFGPEKRLKQFDAGEAVVYFFYMGDSEFRTTIQEATNINKALKGYDKKLLLKHEHDPQGILSAAAERNADRMVKPTSRNLVHCLKSLRRSGYTIDLYVQSHGYDDGAFKTSKGSHGTENKFTDTEIRNLPSKVGGNVPLRMVYQMNCWGSKLNPAWRQAGAKTVCGSRYVNFYPHEIMKFAEAWRHGHTFHSAVKNSKNSRAVVDGVLAYGEAPRTKDEWSSGDDGCPFGKTILGDSPCAREFYLNYWGHDPSEWQNFPNRKNGKANMVHASEQLIAGDGSITNRVLY